MENRVEYLSYFLMLLTSLGVACLMMGLHQLVGPKRPTREKSEVFECGSTPFELPSGNFSIKFYLIAMLFILFDVEIVWFFPWAVILRSLGWAGIVEMFIFIGVLGLGYLYAWKKGALEWVR